MHRFYPRNFLLDDAAVVQEETSEALATLGEVKSSSAWSEFACKS